MIPIFRTCNSLNGRSLLTITDPEEENPDTRSIFYLTTKDGEDKSRVATVKQIFLLEDTAIGLLKAKKLADKFNIHLFFGVRLTMVNNLSEEPIEGKEIQDSSHKIGVFAKNDQGIRELKNTYSLAHTKFGGKIDSETLSKYWSEDLLLCIPFYDSFLYRNRFEYAVCLPDLKNFNEVVFIKESNGLPQDDLLGPIVDSYASRNGFQVEEGKTILYPNREDAEALQVLKIACNRKTGRKSDVLSAPNLDHFASREFCWESFLCQN